MAHYKGKHAQRRRAHRVVRSDGGSARRTRRGEYIRTLDAQNNASSGRHGGTRIPESAICVAVLALTCPQIEGPRRAAVSAISRSRCQRLISGLARRD